MKYILDIWDINKDTIMSLTDFFNDNGIKYSFTHMTSMTLEMSKQAHLYFVLKYPDLFAKPITKPITKPKASKKPYYNGE